MPKYKPPKNELLAALPGSHYQRLLPDLERVPLRQHEIVCKYGAPIRHVFFPEQGLIALLSVLKDGTSIEVGVVGNRGFVGLPLALGGGTCLFTGLVQASGSALRMKPEVFRSEFKRGDIFQKIILNSVRHCMQAIFQSATCNYFHLLPQRVARLLLSIQDQTGSSELAMTHAFISRMIGATRSEVAKTAAQFRSAGLIEYQRGKITLLNREGLEAAACKCYWIVSPSLDGLPKSRR